MKKKAFTLIELLVVIAVIGILVSILLPALRKAKYQARMLMDKTNLKSLGSAVALYLDQNNGKFFAYPESASEGVLWLTQIGNFIDDIDSIRFCPETTMRIEDVEVEYRTNPGTKWGSSMEPWLWNASTSIHEQYEMGSYAFNGWLYAGINDWVPSDMANFPFSSMSDVKITSTTPLFLDGNWVDAWPRNTNVLPASSTMPAGSEYASYYEVGDTSDGTTSTSIGRFVTNRHGRKTNGAFLDMHVETITLEQLWTLNWHKGSRPNFTPTLPQPLPRER